MILLLGATGYIGQSFSSELRHRRLSFIPLTRKAIDYTVFDVLFDYVRKMKPAFVINAAGCAPSPEVEACESVYWDVLCANALLPQTIARVCLMTNTPWGHVSSGSIYLGAKVETVEGQMQIERDLNRPEIRQCFDERCKTIHGFTEWDEPNLSFRRAPCNFYSGSKALAEEAIQGVGKCYIWRPGTIFDEHNDSRNYLSKLQHNGKVCDQILSVSQLSDFVRACLALWERGASFGIYNVVNNGAVTTRQIVEMIGQILKPARDIELLENDQQLSRNASRIPTSNCVLDISKLLAAGVKMRTAEEALKNSLQKWRAAGTTPVYAPADSGPITSLNGMALFEKLFAQQT